MSAVRRAAARLANAALGRFSLAVVRRSRLDRTTHAGMLAHLLNLGLRPQTVFDVGAARGDWTLTSSRYFPHARYLLIEPLDEFRPALQALTARLQDAKVIHAVAATNRGTESLNVHRDLVGSSLLHESEGAATDGTAREIPAVSIDELAAEHGATAPFLVKIDVQGAELHVLAGATEVLQQTEALIVETSLLPFFVDGPVLRDVVAFMTDHGFSVFDVIGHTYRPLDGALAQVDLVFVPDGSPLRADTRFATERQRRQLDALLGKAADVR